MKKLIMVSLFLLVALVSKGIAGDTVRIMDMTDENGKRTVYNTTKAILEKSPDWQLDSEPPFPVHKAAALSEKWIKEKYPKLTNVKIVSISLSPLWEHQYKNKWYYNITAEAGTDLDGISAHSFVTVMVLMDGTVVGPSKSGQDNDIREKENCQQKNRGDRE